MASRISQMRNGMFQPQQPQQQLNESITQVKNLMNNIKTSQNPSVYLTEIINSNPMLATYFKQGNLEQLAHQIAQNKGLNLNNIIQQLLGSQ